MIARLQSPAGRFLLLGLLCALAALLWSASLGRFPLWTDELAWQDLAFVAHRDLDLFWNSPDNVHHPVLLWCLGFWFRFAQDDATLRFLSVAAAVPAIPFWHAALSRRIGRASATATMLLWTLSPFVALSVRQMRWFGLIALASGLFCALAYRFLQHPARRGLLAAALAGALGFLVNQTMGLVLLAVILDAALSGRETRRRALRLALVTTFFIAAAYAASGSLGFVLLERLWDRGGEAVWQGPVMTRFPARLVYGPFVWLVGETLFPWRWLLTVPAALSALGCLALGLRSSWRAKNGPDAAREGKNGVDRPLLLALGAAFSLWAFAGGHPKYAFVLAPLGLALLVTGWRALRSGAPRAAIIAVLALVWSAAHANLHAGRDFHNQGLREPWREVGVLLHSRARPGELIVWISEDMECDRYLMLRDPPPSGPRLRYFTARNRWWRGGLECSADKALGLVAAHAAQGRGVHVVSNWHRRMAPLHRERARAALAALESAMIVVERRRLGLDLEAGEPRAFWPSAFTVPPPPARVEYMRLRGDTKGQGESIEEKGEKRRQR